MKLKVLETLFDITMSQEKILSDLKTEGPTEKIRKAAKEDWEDTLIAMGAVERELIKARKKQK
jgi:hypothetical protein